MNTKALRQKILDFAIHGKLVPQDPNDEPASVLLERIRAEKEHLIKEGKIKKPKKSKAACDKPHYPFELPKGWEWTTLGEVISIKSGNAIKVRNNKNGLFPIYGGNGISGYSDEYNIDKPTIVIGRVGFYCGSIHYVKSKAWVTDNAFITSTYGNVYDIDFLYYLLTYCNLRQYSNSTAQPVISGKTIYPVHVPVPPIKEQRKIVEKIEFWLSCISQLEFSQSKVKSTIKQAKSKILDLAIHGKLVPQDPNDEPASELFKRINPKAEITCDNHQYGKLPKGWCETTLKSLAKEVFAGGDRPTEFTKEKTNGNIIPIYANGVEKDGLYGYTNAARVIEPCLTVSARGTIGFTCIRNIPFVPIVRLITIVPNPAFNLKYMKFCLDCLLIWSEGSSIPQLTVPTIKKMQLPLPPLQEQHRIVAKIEELFTQFDKIEEGVS